MGRPNLICNVEEKTCEVKQIKGLIGRIKNHVFVPKPAHDLKWMQCKSKAMSKMILRK